MAMLYYALAVGEIGLLFVAMASGIVVAVLAGRQSESFNGDCVLAGNVIWTSNINFELNPSDTPRCTYIIYVQAVAAITAFIYAVFRIIVLCSGRFDIALLRVLCIPIYCVMAILILAEAAIMSHGFHGLCDGFRSLQVRTANYDCELFQQVNWHIYDGSGFYEDYSKAQAAGWVAFLSWISLLGVGVLQCLAKRPESGFPLSNNTK